VRKLLTNQVHGNVKDWAIMNAAAILYTAGKAVSLRAAVQLASEALASGAAKEKLAALSSKGHAN
jgi:anthranilate phosphoribosyltransferase